MLTREWRNRQTRTFEGRVGRLVRVQVPSLAPKITDTIWYLLFFCVKYGCSLTLLFVGIGERNAVGVTNGCPILKHGISIGVPEKRKLFGKEEKGMECLL